VSAAWRTLGWLAATVSPVVASACGDAPVPIPGSGGGGVTSSSAVSTGSAGEGAGGEAQPGHPDVGRGCQADADCVDPALSCIVVADVGSVLGGGPAGGYCSLTCEKDSDCGTGNFCWPPAATGTCLLGCRWGDPPIATLEDPLDPGKCHGRDDLRCERVGGSGAVCLPTCQSDAQCAGASCDPRSGLCVEVPTAGDPTNGACDPDALRATCAGSCIGVGAGAGFCASPCSFAGGPLLETADCGGVASGICAYSEPGGGPGDAAFCTGACTAHEDCKQLDLLYCFSFPLGAAIMNGFCYHTTDCTTAGEPCDEPGNFPGSVCTAIGGAGLKCLDPTYPPPVTSGGGAGVGGAGGG
jgi:hypothetical protein